MPPKEPLIYRLYEIVQNYGYAYKAVINEKFGDGIMSAISFSTSVSKETDEKGEWVVIKLRGKWYVTNSLLARSMADDAGQVAVHEVLNVESGAIYIIYTIDRSYKDMPGRRPGYAETEIKHACVRQLFSVPTSSFLFPTSIDLRALSSSSSCLIPASFSS